MSICLVKHQSRCCYEGTDFVDVNNIYNDKQKRCDLKLTLKEIILHNVGGLIQTVEGFKNKRLRFPGEEGILPSDCNIDILLEFSARWPTLWISHLPTPEIP